MRIFVVVKNDLKLFFKDWKAVILFLGLPFAFISLFIYVLSPFLTHNKFMDTFSIALIDEENSLESRMLLNQFIDSEAFKELVTIVKTDENEATNMLRDGKVAAIVIIPEGFVKSMSEGENKPFRVIADSRRPLQAAIIKNFMQSYADMVSASQNGVMTAYVYYSKALSPQKFYSEKYADVVTKFSLRALSSGGIFEKINVSDIPDVTQQEYFTAALLVVFIMFSGIMGIKFTANEKQLGIRSRLEISPMNAIEFTVARFLTVFILSILQFASIIIPGSIFFNIYLRTSPMLMILLFSVIVFTVSACAVFIATVSPSPATADLIGSLGTLLMAVVGGSIYPLTAMPDFVRTLSYFTVNRWAVDGFLQIFSANITSDFYIDLAILAVMGVLYLGISIPFSKKIKFQKDLKIYLQKSLRRMHMLKVITVFKYKLKIIFSNKSFFIAMALIPLFLTFITGYALRYEKQNQVPIVVCDLDNTEYSNILIDRISLKEGLIVIKADKKDAVEFVKNHKAEAAFIIKEGFQENILNGYTEGIIEQLESPSTLSADIIARSIGGEAARLMLNIVAADWVVNEYENIGEFSKNASSDNKTSLWKEAWQHTDSLWEPEPPMKMDYSEIKDNTILQETSPLSGTVESSALGMLTAFLMFLILFNSSWLIDERENSTIKRLIVGTNALGSVFVGNILTLLFIGVIQVAFFWVVTSQVFHISIFNNPGSLLIILTYLLTIIAISLFISSILKTRMQLQTGAPLFSIITGFAGGCFWNFADMSGAARTISLFTPQGLALDLFRNYNIPSAVIDNQTIFTMIFSSWQMIVMLFITIVLIASSYIIIKHQH